MLENEQDFNRNFCPNCLHRVNGIKCENCGTEDLIPKPDVIDFNLMEETYKEAGKGDAIPQAILHKENITDEELYKELTESEKSFIEFDKIKIPMEDYKPIDPSIEKSPLDLDENAVNKLLYEDFGFLTGLAGTGKTTLINELARLHPNLMEVCATTGIAAVNLGTKTLNSTLKYFDTRSLENAHREGLLHMNLRKIRARKQKLLIDEGSMLGAEQFDLIMNAVDEINMDGTGRKLGVWITGDFAQLPPIKMAYVFKSEYWKRFEENTIRLTKIWRQDNLNFIEGINLIRAGKGIAGIALLQKSGVHFTSAIDNNFEGTTLIPKNDGVDAYNMKRLAQIDGQTINVTIKKYGKQLIEWERNIPYILNLKIGAYVMILANDIPEFKFVNGDCGTIESFDLETETFKVKLKRNGRIVNIGRFERKNLSDNEPNQIYGNFQHYSDFKTGDWVIGKIYYHPLRLAYASTVHKCLEVNTIVHEMQRGPIKMANIIKGDAIWNGNNFAVVKAKTRSQQWGLKISLESGEFLICSPQHRFPIIITDSIETCEAQYLRICDRLYKTNRDYDDKIVAIQDLKLKFDMIDIELEDTNDGLNNLFLANNILTHNSQGLSLDLIQIDTNGRMFSNDAMGYVSISRARTPDGLYLVGRPDIIGRKISMSQEVLRYV